MNKGFNYLKEVPLDIKFFVVSCLMIIGILFFPNEPANIYFFLTYIVFIFLSIGVSGVYMTYVGNSKYNFFRTSTTRKRTFFIAVGYIIICVLVSYILAITEWFLFMIA